MSANSLLGITALSIGLLLTGCKKPPPCFVASLLYYIHNAIWVLQDRGEKYPLHCGADAARSRKGDAMDRVAVESFRSIKH